MHSNLKKNLPDPHRFVIPIFYKVRVVFFKLKPLQLNLKVLILKLERKENYEVNYEDRYNNLKWTISKTNSTVKKKKQEVNQRHKDRPTLRHLLMKYIKLPGRLKII